MARFLFPLVACLLTGAPALGGCDAQVDPAYEGEPLATISGSVLTGNSAPPERADVAVLWVAPNWSVANGIRPKMIAARVAVDSGSPASFALDLRSPPPPEAEWTYMPGPYDLTTHRPETKVGVWTGIIAAIAPGTNDVDVHVSDIRGVDRDHVVVYFAQDNPEDPREALEAAWNPRVQTTGEKSYWANDFKVTTNKGYHLAKAYQMQPRPDEFEQQCRTCLGPGLCIRTVGFTDPDSVSFYDWSLSRCMAEDPLATTCTDYTFPSTADERAEDEQCYGLREARSEEIHDKKLNGCAGCGGASYERPQNPAGFADPVVITLGSSFWELLEVAFH